MRVDDEVEVPLPAQLLPGAVGRGGSTEALVLAAVEVHGDGGDGIGLRVGAVAAGQAVGAEVVLGAVGRGDLEGLALPGRVPLAGQTLDLRTVVTLQAVLAGGVVADDLARVTGHRQGEDVASPALITRVLDTGVLAAPVGTGDRARVPVPALTDQTGLRVRRRGAPVDGGRVVAERQARCGASDRGRDLGGVAVGEVAGVRPGLPGGRRQKRCRGVVAEVARRTRLHAHRDVLRRQHLRCRCESRLGVALARQPGRLRRGPLGHVDLGDETAGRVAVCGEGLAAGAARCARCGQGAGGQLDQSGAGPPVGAGVLGPGGGVDCELDLARCGGADGLGEGDQCAVHAGGAGGLGVLDLDVDAARGGRGRRGGEFGQGRGAVRRLSGGDPDRQLACLAGLRRVGGTAGRRPADLNPVGTAGGLRRLGGLPRLAGGGLLGGGLGAGALDCLRVGQGRFRRHPHLRRFVGCLGCWKP